MDEQVEWLAPEDVEPPHEIKDEAKLAEIIASMQKGWFGRPLVVLRLGRVYKAITGSHRIAAAREVLDAIPCLVLDDQQSAAVLGPYNQINYDDSDSRLLYAGYEDLASLVGEG